MNGRVTAAALAAAALLAGAGTASAAFVSEAGSPYAVGADPYTVYAADFNGDGRPDIATVNGTPSNVSIFLRQAGGGFAQEPGSPIAVGAGPGGAAVGDYNGDGRADLAVVNYNDSSVSVLLRQAGGGFALEGGAAISVPGGAQAIAAGDFNGDGRPDLVISLYNANEVTVLLRNAAGGFTSGFTGTTGATPSSIAVGDFNGDALPDFALVNTNGNSVSVRLRLPAGGFASESTDIPVGTKPAGIVAGDFDGDGRTDLAVTNYSPGTVSILLRKATNDGFAEEAGSPIAVSANPVGIVTADVDLDGRADLAVAANGGAVDVLRRNAGGGFTRDPATPLAGYPNGIAAADFDGNARPDLAISAFGTNTFSVLLNPATPAPPAPPPTATPAPLPAPVAGKTVNVAPVSGRVTIKRRGSKRYVALTEAAQIPVGSSIDTRAGRVTITAAQGAGKTASADFFDGLFTLSQTRGAKPVTTLTLTEKLSCPRSSHAAAAAKKKSRRLWGDGSGSFRTRGQYSAATVRGTRWLTQDTCGSTLTRVVRGAVSVRDEVKRKTVIVRAGKRYIARRRR